MTPTIPEGYSLLPTGTIKKEGDLFWDDGQGTWRKTGRPGQPVNAYIPCVRKDPPILNGYAKLKPESPTQPGDLIWTDQGWDNIAESENRTGCVIRKKPQAEEKRPEAEKEEWGTW